MSTKEEHAHSPPATQSSDTAVVESATVAVATPPAPAPVVSPPATPAAPATSPVGTASGTTTTSATSGSTAMFLEPPPPTASIPPVPSSFVPENGTNFRGVAPKKAELVALPLAVSDLRKFTNYATVLGSTAPSYEEILAIFDVTNQWSSMRTASSAWDTYSQVQEGICWNVMRPAMGSLKGAFELAVARDRSLASKFAGLATLLGAKESIAKKASSTKRLNKKAVAEGKPATHVAVGKKRKKQEDKAIVAAAAAAPVTAAAAPVTAAAVSAPAAPVVAVVPAAPAVAAPVNGAAAGVNGAGH